MKCEEDFWIDSVPDGHWWKVVQSSRKDLKGERKSATCLGSFICNNPQYSKYKTVKVKNIIDFKHGSQGSYTCKTCGYYVAREHCGALKAVEYDEESGYITIYHADKNICNVKPEKVNQLKFAHKELLNCDLCKTLWELKHDLIGYYLNEGHVDKAYEVAQKMDDDTIIEKSLICNVKPEKVNQLKFAHKELLNHDLCKTPREFKYDLIGYYLNEGDVDKAYEVAQKIDDDTVIEILRHIGKSSGRNSSKERQIHSFYNIKQSKETTDKQDPFLNSTAGTSMRNQALCSRHHPNVLN